MGGRTAEERLSSLSRLLIVASGALGIVVSLLYLLVALMPIWYFEGYIAGYYGFIDYRLVYNHDGQLIVLPHTNYVRHVSISFAMASMVMLALSTTSTLLAAMNRRVLAQAGVIYGVSCGFVITFGLLYGYLYRVMDLDVSAFSSLITNGDPLVFRTSAGVVIYEGVTVRPSPIYTYVLANGVLRLLITPASVLSALALAIALLKDLRRAEVELKRGEPLSPVRLRMALTYSLLFSTVLFSVASVYTYYPVTVGVSPVPPTATFESPPYYLTCVALTRTARGALNWTDFETYPVPGWASRGGIWSLGTGFKGFALNGTDNNGGIGWASQYYWNRSVGNYSSLWVAVKTRAHTTTDAYKGIGLINGTLNRIYEIAVYDSALTIYKWNGTWRLLGSSSIPGYSPTAWYTIVVNYSVTGVEVRLVAWAYNATGSLVASLNVSDRATDRFTPVYVGVTIDGLGYHLFDDFIVSTRDPRSILFDGFDSGMRVEVWDDLGILVNSTTAPAPSFHLGVTTDVVVGRGSDGRIVVRYPDGFLSGNYTVPLADAILGGDVYNLSLRPMFWSFGPNRTSANLMVYLSSSIAFNTTARILRVNTSQQLYARLILENISAPTTLNASLWLIGSINSTSIEIWSGVPLTRTTNIVALNLGLNNSLALSGYFATTGQNATLWLKLEFCTLPDGRGACFYYPIRLELRSGSSSGTTTAPLGTTTIEPGPSDYFVEWGSDVGPTVDHAVHDGVDYHVDEERLGEDRVTARD